MLNAGIQVEYYSAYRVFLLSLHALLKVKHIQDIIDHLQLRCVCSTNRLRAIRMQGSTSQTEFPNYMDGDMMLKKQAEWQRQFLKDQALVCPEVIPVHQVHIFL